MSDNSTRMIPSSDRVLRSSTKSNRNQKGGSNNSSAPEPRKIIDKGSPKIISTPTSSSSSSSVVRRRKRKGNKSMDHQELGDYTPITTNGPRSGSSSPVDDDDDDDLSPSRNKLYDMNVINNGEKAHLLMEDSLDQHDEISFQDAKPKMEEEESFWSIMVQVFIPFLIAGMGMVAAGVTLDLVQHWPVFKEVPEVFILVPALLGLKGNLEMTLASRLSTQANLGNLDTARSQWHMSVGNLSLVQCQAIVVGFLASVAAIVLGWIPDGHFDMDHALILCTSSVVTASIASFALGLVMVLVIILSRMFRINPDNVATPIAASLGDLTTLALLAFISNSVYGAIGTHKWLCPSILTGYLLSMPCWVILAKRNKLTKMVLYSGWTPVLSAMMISSLGGLILDFTVKKFVGVAVFQPVINGVGGNLVAVQASRISTSFHCRTPLGVLPSSVQRVCTNPWNAFFAKGGHAMTARALILMVVPGHLIFAYTISYIQAGHTSITPVFVIFYLLAALVQVILLLYIAEVLIQYLWLNKIDPDNSAIPYLTALGDVIGTALLALAFLALYAIGDRDSDVGD
ncbi:solute carrier family 41 member 1 [Folsomia candida]|uniref:SLC41A/MgtE integral membrane domain-containing protein n=1 Tax=Folsomia candida TaxID=158441 RepID=A0A226E6W9_FOLCA|nr:solute carrier family 41 member 1 [Folsomia candida]OXA52611.1 hypothetical protein Fcan01_12661 [Folsomia candida]